MNAVAKIKAVEEVTEAPHPLARLREPFPAHQVSKLPKETKKQAEQRKADMDKGNWPAKCSVCEGYHHPNAVHLDYVGHAALTDRLLDTDLEWDWEPVAWTPEGLPALDRNGGLWIKLTVCGKTRLGYGSADGKQGGDAMKELIGDALRNAAMRFGAALDLWHKGDLHVEEEADEPKISLAVTAAQTAITMADSRAKLTAWKAANDEMLKTLAEPAYKAVEQSFKDRWRALAPAREDAEGVFQ